MSEALDTWLTEPPDAELLKAFKEAAESLGVGWRLGRKIRYRERRRRDAEKTRAALDASVWRTWREIKMRRLGEILEDIEKGRRQRR